MFLAAMIGTLSTHASDYAYLTFKTSDGTEWSMNVGALVMTFSDDGKLVATNENGIQQTFTLQGLDSMCFVLRGDVDGSGEVDEGDIDMLVNVIMENEEDNGRCDLNADDKINAADIIVLVNIRNGIVQ